MLRALLALALCATAICGVKGAPRPPEKLSLAAPDAGAASDDADAGCADGGP